MFESNDHTFVLCAYKESPYLEKCVLSLLNQCVCSRVIISTSTPNAHIKSVSTKFGLPLFVNEGEAGISHDWNCAVAHCETPLVTIAHQDDIYLPDYSTRMLEMMNSCALPLIFFSNYGELRGNQEVDDSALLAIKRYLLRDIRKAGCLDSIKRKRALLSFGCSICCPSVTFNTGALPFPLFLDNMKSNLDWEAWERFSKIEGSFVYSDDILVRHRIHSGSETSVLIKDDTRTAEDLRMLSKFWPKPVACIINRAYSLAMRSNSI